MCYIKSLFWDQEDAVMQLHPPQSQYVNLHQCCLHLGRLVEQDIILPDPLSRLWSVFDKGMPLIQGIQENGLFYACFETIAQLIIPFYFMNSTGSTNIYETLKDDIYRWDTILDIGCGELRRQDKVLHTLNDLFSFDSSNFKKIWGIDINPPDFLYCRIMYRNYMLEKLGLSDSNSTLNAEFDKKYAEKYVVEIGDIKTWSCDPESISLIVCDFVLHFFPHSEQPALVKKMMTFLQPGGMLYLRVNSTTHKEITTSKNVVKLGEHTYKEKGSDWPPLTFYLTISEMLLPHIPEFQLLSKYKEENDKNFTLVFRK